MSRDVQWDGETMEEEEAVSRWIARRVAGSPVAATAAAALIDGPPTPSAC